MNYREQQLRQIIKKEYIKKTDYQQLVQDYQHLQANYELIEKDVDYQLHKLTEKERDQLKKDNQKLATKLELHQQKITDLEKSLLNLAQQKIKGKKEAENLIKDLETKWQQEWQTKQTQWQTEKKEWQKQYQQLQDTLFTTKQEAHNNLNLIRKEKNKLTTEVQELHNKNFDLLKKNEDLTKSLTQQEQQSQELTTQWETTKQTYQQTIQGLENKLEEKGRNIDELNNSYSTLEKTNQKQQAIITQLDKDKTRLVLEMRGYQNKEQTIKENLAKIKDYDKLNKENKELIKKATKAEELTQQLDKEKSSHQQQLKDINILFDENAANYETIDFKGLYSLLQQIAERERERR